MRTNTLNLSRAAFLAIVGGLLGASTRTEAQCQQGWSLNEFGSGPILFTAEATNEEGIYDMITYDDGTGSGPEVYVAGPISMIGGTYTNGGFAKWNGSRWISLPHNLNPDFASWFYTGTGNSFGHSFEVFDPDGAGPLRQLLVCGGPASAPPGFSIGTWDGTELKSLGYSHLNLHGPSGIHDMTTWDADGNGTPELYFVSGVAVRVDDPFGGEPAFTCIFRYYPEDPGYPWRNVGLAMLDPNSSGEAMYTSLLYNDGSGTAWYVAGDGALEDVPGTNNIARCRWNAAFNDYDWEPVGAAGLPFKVYKLIAFDPDNAGPAPQRLFAIGSNSAASWDGSNWTQYSFDNGTQHCQEASRSGSATVYQSSSGPQLLVTRHTFCFGATADVYAFNGSGFSPWTPAQAQTFRGPGFIGTFDMGSGAKLTHVINHIRQYDGNAWSSYIPSDATQNRVPSPVSSLVADLDGTGPQPPQVIQAGFPNSYHPFATDFLSARVCGWDGSGWHQYATGLNANVSVMQLAVGAGSPSATSQMLASCWQYLGTDPDGFSITRRTMYQRSSSGVWSQLGSTEFPNIPVPLLANFGSGEQAIAVAVQGVYRWNGSDWETVGVFTPELVMPGSGFSVDLDPDNMILYNDGTGMKLFFSNRYLTNVSGVPVTGGVATWNGTSWADASSGLPAGAKSYRFFVHNGNLMVPVTSGTQGLGMIYRWSAGTWVDSGMRVPTYHRISDTAPVFTTILGSVRLSDGQSHIVSSIDVWYADYAGTAMIYFKVDPSGGPGTELSEWGTTILGEVDSFSQHIMDFEANGRQGIVLTGRNMTAVDGTMVFSTDPLQPGEPLNLISVNAIPAYGLAYYVTQCPPTCVADFNASNSVTVQDIFDFLAAWFAGDVRADINGSNTVTVQDIFDFLSAWFAGC